MADSVAQILSRMLGMQQREVEYLKTLAEVARNGSSSISGGSDSGNALTNTIAIAAIAHGGQGGGDSAGGGKLKHSDNLSAAGSMQAAAGRQQARIEQTQRLAIAGPSQARLNGPSPVGDSIRKHLGQPNLITGKKLTSIVGELMPNKAHVENYPDLLPTKSMIGEYASVTKNNSPHDVPLKNLQAAMVNKSLPTGSQGGGSPPNKIVPSMSILPPPLPMSILPPPLPTQILPPPLPGQGTPPPSKGGGMGSLFGKLAGVLSAKTVLDILAPGKSMVAGNVDFMNRQLTEGEAFQTSIPGLLTRAAIEVPEAAGKGIGAVAEAVLPTPVKRFSKELASGLANSPNYKPKKDDYAPPMWFPFFGTSSSSTAVENGVKP